MARQFQKGDRVTRDDGMTGTVTNTEFYPTIVKGERVYFVSVKWDASGSTSHREETGLTLLERAA